MGSLLLDISWLALSIGDDIILFMASGSWLGLCKIPPSYTPYIDKCYWYI